jgi:hypothetical protein
MRNQELSAKLQSGSAGEEGPGLEKPTGSDSGNVYHPYMESVQDPEHQFPQDLALGVRS